MEPGSESRLTHPNCFSARTDMNGERGMASANALPRIRKHESDTNHSMGADSRHGSSRDYYVSFYLHSPDAIS